MGIALPSGADIAQGMKLAWTILQIAFGVLVLFAIAIGIWFVSTFKYRVQIIERRGELDQIVYYDWGKLVEIEPGAYRLKLFWLKKDVEVPNYKYITTLTGNMFRKNLITLFRSSIGTFNPVDYQEILHTEKLRAEAIDMDVETYLNTVQMQERKFLNQKKLWDYVVLASPIVQFILLLLIVYFTFKGINGVVEASGQIASALVDASNKLAQCVVPPGAPGFTG